MAKMSTNDLLRSLLTDSKPRLEDLQLRRLKKIAEKKRLLDKAAKQQSRMVNLVADMKSTESQTVAVSTEIESIEAEIASFSAMDVQ